LIYLNVPFSQKDEVKSKGARWHGERRRWYLPDGVDPIPFYAWLPSIEQKKIDEQSIDSPKEDKKKGITLSNLLSRVSGAVSSEFKLPVWVNCEIASLNTHNSGHIYLELIETDSNGREICKNKAIIWKSLASKLIEKFKNKTEEDLKSGMKVLLLAEVEFNLAFGLSMKISDIDPEFTLGGIEAKINEIRNALKKQGLYDKNKKFDNLIDFTNIAVISPSGAAGLGDFKAEADLLEHYNLCNFDYYEATFQGKQANKSISELFNNLENDFRADIYDAVVFIRGGGAKTDLHFLNEYDIAKSICECSLPVIVGIGHERDKVILDELAFVSLDTPSKVAQFITHQIISQTNESIQNMDYIRSSSKELVNKYIYYSSQFINEIVNFSKTSINSLIFENESNINFIKETSSKIVHLKKQENDNLLQNIIQYSKNKVKYEIENNHILLDSIFNDSKNKIEIDKKELESILKEIDAYNPQNVLNKGYSIIKKNNKTVKKIEELNDGDTVEIQIGNKKKTFKITKEN
jgi:exodeoxyribonuclease VII large subunit